MVRMTDIVEDDMMVLPHGEVMANDGDDGSGGGCRKNGKRKE
jgi:hypothetical protein